MYILYRNKKIVSKGEEKVDEVWSCSRVDSRVKDTYKQNRRECVTGSDGSVQLMHTV